MLIVSALDQRSERLGLEKERLVLIEQIVDVDSVRVCEVAFEEYLLVADMEQSVAEQDSWQREQVYTLDEHESVHKEVVAHLCRHIEQACRYEAVCIAEMVEAHHLL